MIRTMSLVLLSLALPAAPAAAQVLILHSFAGGPDDGQNADGSLAISGSTLFGLTNGGGSANDGALFKVGADGTGFALLHSFVGGPNDGIFPSGSLSRSGSTLFGTTEGG